MRQPIEAVVKGRGRVEDIEIVLVDKIEQRRNGIISKAGKGIIRHTKQPGEHNPQDIRHKQSAGTGAEFGEIAVKRKGSEIMKKEVTRDKEENRYGDSRKGIGKGNAHKIVDTTFREKRSIHVQKVVDGRAHVDKDDGNSKGETQSIESGKEKLGRRSAGIGDK